MALPKLEGAVTFGSTQTVTFQENGAGGGSITLAAVGTYYLNTSDSLSSLCATIAANLTAATTHGATYTVTVDDNADASTGKVTIAGSGGTLTSFAITWTSTTVRDVLGFTGNVSGSLSYQGSKSSQYLFLPNVKRSNPMSPDGMVGVTLTDGTVTVAPDGTYKALAFAKRYADNLEFAMLSGQKAWIINESTGNESWESFYDFVCSVGSPFRYHLDRSDDTTFVTWVSTRINDIALAPQFPGFVGDVKNVNRNTLWHLGPMPVIKKV